MGNSVNNANSFKDFKETHTMFIKSLNIETMMGSKTVDVIEELCKSILQNYKKDL